MEPPKRPKAMIRKVPEPVAPVHRDEDRRNHESARNRTDPRERKPRQVGANEHRERKRERRHEGDDQRRIKDREQHVLTAPAGKQWSVLCGPKPLRQEQSSNDHKRRWSDNDNTKTRHRAKEIFAAPSICPTKTDKDRCHDCYGTGGGVHVRADDARQRNEPSGPPLGDSRISGARAVSYT